jgi:hypothetical protein
MASITQAQVDATLSKLNIDISKQLFTREDVLKGANVELEHGTIDKLTNITNDDAETTIKIALAHLREQRPASWIGSSTKQNYDYYDALSIIEDAPAGYWKTNLWTRHFIVLIICILLFILCMMADAAYNKPILVGLMSICAVLYL